MLFPDVPDKKTSETSLLSGYVGDKYQGLPNPLASLDLPIQSGHPDSGMEMMRFSIMLKLVIIFLAVIIIPVGVITFVSMWINRRKPKGSGRRPRRPPKS